MSVKTCFTQKTTIPESSLSQKMLSQRITFCRTFLEVERGGESGRMVSAQIFVLVNLLLQMFTFSPERFLTHCLCGFLASKLFCLNQLCKLFCNNSVPPPHTRRQTVSSLGCMCPPSPPHTRRQTVSSLGCM